MDWLNKGMYEEQKLDDSEVVPAKGIRLCERKAPTSGSQNKSLFTNETTPQTNKGDANSNASGIRKGLSAVGTQRAMQDHGITWTLEHRFHLHRQ